MKNKSFLIVFPRIDNFEVSGTTNEIECLLPLCLNI